MTDFGIREFAGRGSGKQFMEARDQGHCLAVIQAGRHWADAGRCDVGRGVRNGQPRAKMILGAPRSAGRG